MKELELRLISELMKNSRRSDRELAKVIGTSQPTVSRMIQKLEKEEIIKEYTMMPDFCKMGFQLMSLIFIRLKTGMDDEIERVRQTRHEELQKIPFDIIMLERGIGKNSDGVILALHKDYSSYSGFMEWLGTHAFLEETRDTFLINLQDKIHYIPLTMSVLAKHLTGMSKEKQ